MSGTPNFSGFTSVSPTPSGSNLGIQMGNGSPMMPLNIPPEGLTISATASGRIDVRSSGPPLSRAATLVDKGSRVTSNTSTEKPLGAPADRRGSDSTVVEDGGEDEKRKPRDLGGSAVRWAQRYRYWLLLSYYITFTILLIAPSVLTPALVWIAIRSDIDAGFNNPAGMTAGRNYLAPNLPAFDRILTVAITVFAMVNTGLTLAMRGLDLIAPPWAQNLLTAIGVMATVSAVRNSIQLPIGVL